MFDTYFGLKLAHFIFAAAEQFSTNLQKKYITVPDALHGSELLISHLRYHRTEPKFNQFYDKTIMQAANLTEQPALPRYHKVLKRFNYGAHSHCYYINSLKIDIAMFIMRHLS